MRRIFSSTLLSLALGFSAHSTQADNQYSDMIVFGDSLSDTGNLQVFSQDPNTPSRFTNGPVAIEVLAAQLGLTISNALHLTGAQYGNNFAVAGAIAIDEDGDESTPDINLPTQINSYLAFNGYQADPNALHIVMIGGNDIRAARTLLISGEPHARHAAKQRLRQATQSIKAQLKKLDDAGAKHFLVVNAPDVGAIPETDLVAAQLLATAETRRQTRQANRLEDRTQRLSSIYNARLSRLVERLKARQGMDIEAFDLQEFFTDLQDDSEQYGITNTEDACIYVFSAGGAMHPECDFETFTFFDEIHPTSKVHQLAGAAIFNTLTDHE